MQMRTMLYENYFLTMNLLQSILECTGRKVLVADAWNVCPPLETGLEIAARLGSEGFDVTYIHYGSVLPYVEFFNPSGNIKDRILGYAPSPQQRGVIRLNAFAKENKLRVSAHVANGYRPPIGLDIDESRLVSLKALTQLEFLGSNIIGVASASSLVSVTRNSRVRPSEHRELCLDIISSFQAAYHFILRILSRSSFDLLIMHNGRFAWARGAHMAAMQLGVPTYFHDQGSTFRKFGLFSFAPFERLSVQKNILDTWWAVSSVPEARALSRSFFEQRRQGVDQAWYSFTKEQSDHGVNELLEKAKNLSSSGKVIVYFSSSDDEFVSVGNAYSMSSFDWKSQAEALSMLIKLADVSGHSVIIRVHPNVDSASKDEIEIWNSLSFVSDLKNVIIVPSHSKVSSYALLDNADLVATFGSTMGIESVYWGKPTVLLGNSVYDSIGATVNQVKSLNTLATFIADPQCWSVTDNSADPYGYYMSTFGVDYLYYHARSPRMGSFLGENLHLYKKTMIHKTLHFLQCRS